MAKRQQCLCILRMLSLSDLKQYRNQLLSYVFIFQTNYINFGQFGVADCSKIFS